MVITHIPKQKHVSMSSLASDAMDFPYNIKWVWFFSARLWTTVPEEYGAWACFALLNIRSRTMESDAFVLVITQVGYSVFGASWITHQSEPSGSGAASLWYLSFNDASNRNFLSNISIRTIYVALAKRIASLAWSPSFLRASPISSRNVRSPSLPCGPWGQRTQVVFWF